MQSAWSGSNEPLTFHQGLNVNMNTERYQREDISSPYSSNHLLQRPGRIAYGIWTANFAELAEACGLDAEKLQAVVDRYNECVAADEDLDFHKNPDYLIEIKAEGPFYCARNYPMFMSTEAGLNNNMCAQVCDANDRPIPGLFSIGQMMGNMYANKYNFAMPDMSYGINCTTYGYLLGRDLAAGRF